jgi:serine O-acetyltransferase
MPAACICQGSGLVRTIRADLDRYVYHLELEDRTGWLALPRIILLSPGFIALAAYRCTHFALHRISPRPLAMLAALPSFLLQRLVLALSGIEIDVNAHIGPGLLIPHAGTMVIGAARIGQNCDIAHGVTLGRTAILHGGKPLERPTPTLGDRVWIGPGSVLTGDVKIGSDAVIGANSVILREVPPHAVVLGVPARLISWRGSFSQIVYRGMDEDPDRVRALARNAQLHAPESRSPGEEPGRGDSAPTDRSDGPANVP